MRQFWQLGFSEALELQDHVLKLAADQGLVVAVCVVNAHAHQLCAATMDGVPDNITRTAKAKAVTAATYGFDTVKFRFRLRAHGVWEPWSEAAAFGQVSDDGWSPEDLANERNINLEFCSWAGGSVVLNAATGEAAGAIGVSALAELDDHKLASSRPSGWSE